MRVIQVAFFHFTLHGEHFYGVSAWRNREWKLSLLSLMWVLIWVPVPFACYMNCEQTVFLTGPVPQGICVIKKTNKHKPKYMNKSNQTKTNREQSSGSQRGGGREGGNGYRGSTVCSCMETTLWAWEQRSVHRNRNTMCAWLFCNVIS